MKKMFIYISIFFFAFLLFIVTGTRPIYVTVHVAPDSLDTYELTPSELENSKHSADKGDAEAALRIFYYYYYAKNDQKTALVWLHRSNALGEPSAKDILIEVYKEKE